MVSHHVQATDRRFRCFHRLHFVFTMFVCGLFYQTNQCRINDSYRNEWAVIFYILYVMSPVLVLCVREWPRSRGHVDDTNVAFAVKAGKGGGCVSAKIINWQWHSGDSFCGRWQWKCAKWNVSQWPSPEMQCALASRIPHTQRSYTEGRNGSGRQLLLLLYFPALCQCYCHFNGSCYCLRHLFEERLNACRRRRARVHNLNVFGSGRLATSTRREIKNKIK